MSETTVCLSDLCDLVSESVAPNERPDDLYLGLEHLASGRLVWTGGGQASEMRSSTSKFQRGDVLYGKLRPYLDKAVLADRGGVCTTELLVLRAKEGVEPRFLALVVHSPNFVKYAVAGTTGVQHPRTSWAHIREFKMPAFTQEDQSRIADLLWLVHKAITQSEALVKVTQSLKRAAMRMLFTHGLRGEAQKKTDIGLVPESWSLIPLGTLCEQGITTIILGQSPPSSTYNQTGDGLPFFQGKADFGLLHPTPRVWCNAGQKFASAGDVLISVRAPVGDVNVAMGDCAIGRGIAAVRPSSGIDPWFLYFVLLYAKPVLESRATGSTFGSVNKTTLNDLAIPFPRRTEQSQIGDILSAIDGKICIQQKKCAILNELLNILLHKLMTGEIRVVDLDLSGFTKEAMSSSFVARGSNLYEVWT